MSRVPKYRRHVRGYAFVQHKSIPTSDHRLYLGAYNSPESIAKYRAFLARLEAGEPACHMPTAAASTVSEAIAAYLVFARQHYRRGDELSHEFDHMRAALASLEALQGDCLIADYGPKRLKQFRTAMARSGLARSTVNHDLSRVKRMFRWACEEEIAPADLYSKLIVVKGLYKGQDNCREPEKVKPAPIAAIDSIVGHLSPTVAAMVRVQYYCGMRPGEVCIMRACDLDMSGDVWLYRPQRHKTEWRGFDQVKAVPSIAQSIIKQFMRPERESYLFSPTDTATWCAEQRISNAQPRKTKRYPSEVRRVQLLSRKRKRRASKHGQRDPYTTKTYYRALQYGFKRATKAGIAIEQFTPNQIRHSIGTHVSQLIGEQAAQRYLGHDSLDTTKIYTERQVCELIEYARQLDAKWAG